jgi:hypothetical protein
VTNDIRVRRFIAGWIAFLTPLVAEAHGEQYVLNLFVGGALVPAWAIFSYRSVGRRVPADGRRNLACGLAA